MENNFVHLNLHTEYSLSEGVNSIDSFLTRAKELGMTSLAVTDYANMFCAVEFYQKAKKMGQTEVSPHPCGDALQRHPS